MNEIFLYVPLLPSHMCYLFMYSGKVRHIQALNICVCKGLLGFKRTESLYHCPSWGVGLLYVSEF